MHHNKKYDVCFKVKVNGPLRQVRSFLFGEAYITNETPYIGLETSYKKQKWDIQYNFDGSNTDGSFTVDDSNSFLSPFDS